MYPSISGYMYPPNPDTIRIHAQKGMIGTQRVRIRNQNVDKVEGIPPSKPSCRAHRVRTALPPSAMDLAASRALTGRTQLTVGPRVGISKSNLTFIRLVNHHFQRIPNKSALDANSS